MYLNVHSAHNTTYSPQTTIYISSIHLRCGFGWVISLHQHGCEKTDLLTLRRFPSHTKFPGFLTRNLEDLVFCVRLLVPESTAVVLRDREASSAGQGIPTGSEAATWDTQEIHQHQCSGFVSFWASRIRMRNYLP
jgi:hypothetical protein